MHRPSRFTPAARLGTALVVLAALMGAFTLVLSAGTTAHAATVNPYQVTFVARECPNYTDIMANLARNNIQESQQDLGPDSVYRSGQPISPSLEAANDPDCTPLDGWQFTVRERHQRTDTGDPPLPGVQPRLPAGHGAAVGPPPRLPGQPHRPVDRRRHHRYPDRSPR